MKTDAEKTETTETPTRYKVIIIVLSVLLAISLALLAIQFVRKAIFSSGEATIKNNSIGMAEKSWSLSAKDLLPGDSVSNSYEIVYYLDGRTPVLFRAIVDTDSTGIADVLTITVEDTDSGEVICSGRLGEIAGRDFSDTVEGSGDSRKTVTYKITLTLDTSAGNEYQSAELALRFRWSLEKEGDGQ